MEDNRLGWQDSLQRQKEELMHLMREKEEQGKRLSQGRGLDGEEAPAHAAVKDFFSPLKGAKMEPRTEEEINEPEWRAAEPLRAAVKESLDPSPGKDKDEIMAGLLASCKRRGVTPDPEKVVQVAASGTHTSYGLIALTNHGRVFEHSHGCWREMKGPLDPGQLP